MQRYRWLLILAAAALFGYLFWANVQDLRGEPVSGGEAPLVMTMPVSRGVLVDRVVAPASIAAADATELRAPFAADRLDLTVAVGDPVKQGSVLLRLNTDELMSEIRTQEAKVIEARARYEQALREAQLAPRERERQLQEAERRVAEAEAALVRARENGAAAVRTARERLTAAEAALAVGAESPQLLAARLTAEAALRDLAANPGDPARQQSFASTQEQYLRLEREALETAQAAREAVLKAREELDRATEERDRAISQAERELADAQFALEKLQLEQAASPGTDPVAAAEQALTGAQEALAALERKLAEAEIRSPLDGVVLAVDVQDGQAVTSGAKLVTVGRLDEVEVQLRVDEADIAKLSVGQPLTLRAQAFPEAQFEGSISFVPLQAGEGGSNPGYYGPGGSSTFLLKGMVQNPEGKLRVGMNAEAEIVTTHREGVVLVGLEALRKDGGPHVFVLEGETARRRDVIPGATSRTQVEIQEGLNDGDIMIIGPFPVLKELQDGQQVQVEGGMPEPGAQGGAMTPGRGTGK